MPLGRRLEFGRFRNQIEDHQAISLMVGQVSLNLPRLALTGRTPHSGELNVDNFPAVVAQENRFTVLVLQGKVSYVCAELVLSTRCARASNSRFLI